MTTTDASTLNARSFLRALVGFMLLCAMLLRVCLPEYCRAQALDQTSGWSVPEVLYSDPYGFTRVDYLVVDSAGMAHAFWASNPESPYDVRTPASESAIFYQEIGKHTTGSPLDVLLESDATMPFGAVVDAGGNLHVITSAGVPPCLRHIWVFSADAGSVKSWSRGSCISDIGVGAPDLATDGKVLYTIYAARDQSSIVFASSPDQGLTWSDSRSVAHTEENGVFLAYPRLALDSKGRLHAVWGEVTAPSGYPWIHIMYAHSTDGGQSWTPPIELADGHQGEPSLATNGDELHVVWNGDAGYQGRYYRFSPDAGQTWSSRMALPLLDDSGGLQGAPAIVTDDSDVVHIAYTDGPELYYITQADGQWSSSVLMAGPSNTDVESEINYPRLGITEGNTLHAIYTADASRVYYQQLKIGAQHIPASSYANTDTSAPDMHLGAEAGANTNDGVVAQQTSFTDSSTYAPNPSGKKGKLRPVLVGMSPVILLLGYLTCRAVASRSGR